MTTPSVEDIDRMIRVASQFSEFTCRSEPLLPVLELARKAAVLRETWRGRGDEWLYAFDALLADPSDTGGHTDG